MTTPDHVDAILAEDERLTAAQRDALADLFRAAYWQLTNAAPQPATDDDLTPMPE